MLYILHLWYNLVNKFLTERVINMNIITERLILRPIIQEDMLDYFKFYSDEENCRYLLNEPWNKDNMEDNFKPKLENKSFLKRSSTLLSVVFKNKAIGEISIISCDMKDTIEIGYIFNSDYAHQGFALEALTATFDYLFLNKETHRIYADVDARNFKSTRLCENLSMRKEAHHLEDYWNKGEWTDSLIFAILKREWLADKK